MGIDYKIIQGYGYVVPRNSVTKDEEKKISDLMNDFDIGMSYHDCYSKSIDGQFFIYLRKDIKVLTDVKLHESSTYSFKCKDFAVVSQNGTGIDKEVLNTKKRDLEKFIKKQIPSLHDKIITKFNSQFENWIFGFLK